MAWNQTKNDTPPSCSEIKVRNVRMVLACCVALSLAIVCVILFYFMFPEKRLEDKKVLVRASPQKISEPKAQLTTNCLAEEENKLSMNEKKLKEIYDKFGDNIPDNYKPIVYFLKNPPKRGFAIKGSNHFLRHPSERQIAGLLLVDPGSYFVQQPHFNSTFDQDFLSALLDKIDINDDDSDDVREVKESVSTLKKEISEICRKEGKRPSEVMNEYAQSMCELGRFQRNLENELVKIHADEDLTDADVENYYNAANQMLESKGLKPMAMPSLARRSIRLRHKRERTRKKETK